MGSKPLRKSSGTGRRPVQDTLNVQRRNLPHWQLGGATYYVTYRCVDGIELDPRRRDIVLTNWQHWDGNRYLLHTMVVMPDHVHVLITPRRREADFWYSLEEILHTNKGFTANQINKEMGRAGSLWQDERFDRIVRDDAEFWQKWKYIAENPVRANLVKKPLHYQWLYQNSAAMHESTG
jgi:putative transposase